jgi:hypothetical protein
MLWFDNAQNLRHTWFNCDPNGFDVMTAMENCSNARINHFWEGPTETPASALPVNSQYVSVDQVAALRISSFAGWADLLYIPAPKLSIFQSDGSQVNLANLDVMALVTAIDGEILIPPDGHTATAITQGWLLQRASRVQQSIRINGYIGDQYRTALVWADAQGRTTLQTYWHVSAIPDPVVGAMIALSNAQLLYEWTGPTAFVNGTPSTAPYPSVGFGLKIQMVDTTGSYVSLLVPAPKNNCFHSDGYTMNDTDVNVAALLATVMSDMRSWPMGHPIDAIIGGFRVNTPVNMVTP